MKRPTIIATNDTLREIVRVEIAKYGKNADLNHIDVSKVTEMVCTFYATTFNGNISKWNVSNVTDMQSMFQNSRFNGDISNWNVSNVTNMKYMFFNSQFQGDISKWDVSNVKQMESMFRSSDFNGHIDHWNVSNVTNMSRMFQDSAFNGDISNWNVSNVTNMLNMFSYSKFKGNLSNWSMRADCDTKWMIKTIRKQVVPPLLQVDSITEYVKKLESMSGTSIENSWFYARDNSMVAITVNHGVSLLFVPDQNPEILHPALTREDTQKLQLLYQLTGSVYQSVKAWQQQRQQNIPTQLTSMDFA